jgi:hypothetical protein
MALTGSATPQPAAGYTAPAPAGSGADDASSSGSGSNGSRGRGSGGSGGDLHRWLAADVPVVMSRNLFAVRLDYFPTDGSRPRENSRTQKDETFWDALAKSISSEADQQERRKNLVQNLRDQADRLQLLSTVMGAKPKAMINGELVGEGDVIAAFRVIRIEARRVIVEREGIRLEITMK